MLVDTWVAFKINDGYNYLYADTNSWALALSPYSMNSTTDGALAQTLGQTWSFGLEFIAYNDEPPSATAPNPANGEYGHTKGFLAWSTAQGYGFWLTHSAPAFPRTPLQAPSGYQGLSDNAEIYAQSFLCKSLTMTEVNMLAAQLTNNSPEIYSHNVLNATEAQYPGISGLVNKDYPKTASCAPIQIGNLTIFAKTDAFDQDLYAACIAPYYASDMYAETWIRGSACGPACPPKYKYSTLDVQALSFTPEFTWGETNDHSKWAIAVAAPIVCIADINRMTTQYPRGGGAACMEQPLLWAQINAAITQHDSC